MTLRELIRFCNYRKEWLLLYETDGHNSFVISIGLVSKVDSSLLDYKVIKYVLLHDDLISVELKERI